MHKNTTHSSLALSLSHPLSLPSINISIKNFGFTFSVFMHYEHVPKAHRHTRHTPKHITKPFFVFRFFVSAGGMHLPRARVSCLRIRSFHLRHHTQNRTATNHFNWLLLHHHLHTSRLSSSLCVIFFANFFPVAAAGYFWLSANDIYHPFLYRVYL